MTASGETTARGGCTAEDWSKIALRREGELWHGHTRIALTCAAGGGCGAHARAASGGSDDVATRGGCTEENVSKIALRWEGALWHGHTRMTLTCAAGGGC